MNWLPIESAPKDGRAILVWPVWSQAEADSDKDICAPAYWNTWYPDAPHWREATGEHYEHYQPTHWMPLPPPPAAKE